MARDADLEIVLSLRDDGRFDVSAAYDDPRDVGDKRQAGDDPISIDADGELRLLTHDPVAYGRVLAGDLFASAMLREFYLHAKAAALSRPMPLRVRLSIDPEAPPRIWAIRWETLHDPEDDTPIALHPGLLFSRYLSGARWDLISPSRKHDLRALVVVSNPSDLDGFDPDGATLAPIDVPAELKLARGALGGMEVIELASGGTATLETVATELESGIDVLYLVCHGALVDGSPVLYLENEAGKGVGVDGRELEARIDALRHKPTLAVLCSCQSAGPHPRPAIDEDAALVPLGPLLARVGVAAVVAIQDDIAMDTARTFLETFFAQLRRHGVVDLAVAEGRGAVRGQPEWWSPVLFSRLKRGRTFYATGFGGRGELRWRALIDALGGGMCTPVLGPGLAETVLGSRAQHARNWVERWLLPIPAPSNEDLTTVAQFVQAELAQHTAHKELVSNLVSTLESEKRNEDVKRELFDRANPDPLIRELGRRQRETNTDEPHAVIASLEVPIFITTSWTNLLAEALEERGRPPVIRHFDWNGRDEDLAVVIGRPSVENPLVYHLFGRIGNASSLVLTEDDYFQWLVAWVSKRTQLVPKAVLGALTQQSLMFMGYTLDSWDFRVLFQSLKTFGGHKLLVENQHVGVQLDPRTPGVEPEAAQEHLETYFDVSSTAIYWGTTREFLSELAKRRESW